MEKKLKLALYGDSLSTGTHGEGGYEKMLADSLCLASVNNYAVGSSTLTMGREGSMVQLIEEGEIPISVDIILIWHGTNDWYWGHPLGEMGDISKKTFYGAIFYVIEKLRKANPSAMIIWVMPIFRKEKPFDCIEEGNAHILPNRIGRTLAEYTSAIEKCSSVLGFPLIDMHRYCGIHHYNSEIYLEDNVHPNRKGYEIIHRILDREIRRLI